MQRFILNEPCCASHVVLVTYHFTDARDIIVLFFFRCFRFPWLLRFRRHQQPIVEEMYSANEEESSRGEAASYNDSREVRDSCDEVRAEEEDGIDPKPAFIHRERNEDGDKGLTNEEEERKEQMIVVERARYDQDEDYSPSDNSDWNSDDRNFGSGSHSRKSASRRGSSCSRNLGDIAGNRDEDSTSMNDSDNESDFEPQRRRSTEKTETVRDESDEEWVDEEDSSDGAEDDKYGDWESHRSCRREVRAYHSHASDNNNIFQVC